MTQRLLLDIPNACTPADDLCTGGHPQPEHLREAQRRGVRTVVNLRPSSEACDYDEAALVASLGMRYVNIPVAGPADLTVANARKLANAIKEGGDKPALIHCASGNRVGALFALIAHHIDGASIDEALAAGRAAGLKALEPVVRQILSN